MEKLIFDRGIREFDLGGSKPLRFNPSDPNVYARFADAIDEMKKIEDALVEKAKASEESADTNIAFAILKDADASMKKVLSGIFGAENNFHEILGGVNVMAVVQNGERVITNLLSALLPIIEEGAERFAQLQTDTAVEQAKKNRALREAQQ